MIPWRIRKYLRLRHRKWVFARAMKAFEADPQGCLLRDAAILERLAYGWNNEDWSACGDYLHACLQRTLDTRGPILECGSGLSTLLLGMIAQRIGGFVWSLEHHGQWAERVAGEIERFGIRSVRLCVSPLKDYGEYTWYDPPLATMPDGFAGVVCDGPPGETKGGRYGMMPVMRSRLKPGAWVLLDDADRENERAIAARWANESGASCEIHRADRPYVALTMPAA